MACLNRCPIIKHYQSTITNDDMMIMTKREKLMTFYQGQIVISVDNSGQIDTFCNKFIVEEHLVKDSLEHLINLTRTKAIKDSDRKRLKEAIKDIRACCYCTFRVILCAHFSLIQQSNTVFSFKARSFHSAFTQRHSQAAIIRDHS